MKKNNNLVFVTLVQFFCDIFTMIYSFVIAYFISTNFTKLDDLQSYYWILIIFIPTMLLCMNNLEMYNSSKVNSNKRIFRNITFSFLLSSGTLAALIYLMKIKHLSRLYFFLFIFISFAILFFQRYIYNYLSKRYLSPKKTKSIIIGCNDFIYKANNFIQKTNLNIDNIGYINFKTSEDDDLNNIGKITELEEILKANVIDEVLFAIPPYLMYEIEEYIHLCETMGKTVRILWDFNESKFSRSYVTLIENVPMLTIQSVPANKLNLAIKRTIDIVGSSIGLVFLGFISIFVVLAIKIDSKGPAFFTQTRIGLNGRKFKIYKFRTMYTGSELKLHEVKNIYSGKDNFMTKDPNDPRITKVGNFLRKTSIDEFPQFINVLKGEMSLVGTRPPLETEVLKYKTHHTRRISIKPGITGLWQVSGRSNIHAFDKVVKLDTEYIDKWSLILDLKILFKTIFIVFSKEGAI